LDFFVFVLGLGSWVLGFRFRVGVRVSRGGDGVHIVRFH
jgi:hypothetical protein